MGLCTGYVLNAERVMFFHLRGSNITPTENTPDLIWFIPSVLPNTESMTIMVISCISIFQQQKIRNHSFQNVISKT
jgi:hypothetical protein